jgi:hypothetical protein
MARLLDRDGAFVCDVTVAVPPAGVARDASAFTFTLRGDPRLANKLKAMSATKGGFLEDGSNSCDVFITNIKPTRDQVGSVITVVINAWNPKPAGR